ncbi:MAG: rhomboid family intramembrane serine protease [Actinobacteria bacterium]|jgi:membrane associated rhomboid family serine protease|nr:MAG: rhomboid family intramembrane serine protease [Actinomycetota bacterium]
MFPIRDVNPTRTKPVVNWIIIAINVAVFMLVQPWSFKSSMSPQDADQQAEFLYAHAMVPCEVTHLEPLSAALVADCGGQPVGPATTNPFFPGKHVLFAVLASMFFHANILHIAGNMFFLWMFGDNVEDRLGHSAYVIFYLVGGIAAAVGHVLSNTSSIVPVVGASGAIAAVMGAYLVQSPKARLTAVVPPFIFLPFRIPAWIFLIEWLVLQFFTSADSGVAWIAHVAGFTAGAILALWLRRADRVARSGYARFQS